MTPALTLLLLAGCGDTAKLSAYNMPPTVTITAPVDGSAVDEGAQIDFTALVSDVATAPGDLELSWSSDLSGVLDDGGHADANGIVVYATASLVPGAHVVSLTATDPQGEQGVATVTVTVNGRPEVLEPRIEIIRPAAGQQGAVDTAFPFLVRVSDDQDAPEALHVTFESDLDGVFCELDADAAGHAGCDWILSPNDGDPSVDVHHLTFTVTDTTGRSAYALYDFHVLRVDADGDGFSPDADDPAFVDCDDYDPSIYPRAPESCNAIDDDCDAEVDEPGVIDGVRLYQDADGDGYGASTGAGMVLCEPEGLYTVTTNTDCDDTRADVSPSVPEACFDNLDNDCDGVRDEGDGAIGAAVYYPDLDRDGFGAAGAAGVAACLPVAPNDGANANDCDDADSRAYPGQAQCFETPRAGVGGYDFDCSGGLTPQDGAVATCDWELTWGGFNCYVETSGWAGGSVPACGTAALWSDIGDGDSGCSQCGTTSCCPTGTMTRTQACR